MTANVLETFLAAQRVFSERVHAITEDQWLLDTPDDEWNVADLVEHLAEEHRWVGPLVHGHNMAAAEKIVAGSRRLPIDGGVGANRAEEWAEAAAASADAFSADGALDGTVELSRGTTPTRNYIGEMIFDLVVHSWDLGVAIGYAEPVPAELAEIVWDQAQHFGDLHASGLFAKPVEVPDDAPSLDRLLGLTGRRPR